MIQANPDLKAIFGTNEGSAEGTLTLSAASERAAQKRTKAAINAEWTLFPPIEQSPLAVR